MGEVKLINTPGYFYSIAYWLSFCLYSGFLKKRFGRAATWAIRIGGIIILFPFMEVTKYMTKGRFVVSMVVVAAFLFSLFLLTCHEDKYKCGYYFIRSFLVGECQASLAWQIYYYIQEQQPLFSGVKWSLLIMALVYLAGFLIFYAMDARYEKADCEIPIGRRECLTVGVIVLAVYVFSNASYVHSNTPFSSVFSWEVFIIRTLADFGGLAVVFAYHLQLMQVQYMMESHCLRQMIDVQYANYQLSQQSIELVNQKYHDLKHQIAILRNLAQDKGVVKSIDAIEQEIKSYEAQNQTGNKVLDTILTSKSLYCQKLEIQLSSVVDGTTLDFIDVMDLSALFGNILDNAIEGCLKVKELEKRLIHLTVVQQKGFLRIRCENCCEDNISFQNGLVRTTKANTQLHGFGMKSIRNIAEKYGGSATFEVKGNWFEVRVLIPIKK